MYKGTGGTVVSNTPVPQTPTMSEQKRKPFIVAGAVVRPVEAAGHRFALSRRPVNSMKFRAGADKYPDSDPDSASPAVTIRTNIPTGCVIDVEFPANIVPGDSTNYFFTLFKHNLSGEVEDEDEIKESFVTSDAGMTIYKKFCDYIDDYSRSDEYDKNPDAFRDRIAIVFYLDANPQPGVTFEYECGEGWVG